MDDKNLGAARDPNMDADSNKRNEQEDKPLSGLLQSVLSIDDHVGGKVQEEHKTDPEKNCSTIQFLNPLMMNSLVGNVEIIKYLLNLGFTDLSITVTYGNCEAVNFLILNGIDLSNDDSTGLTLFMRATKSIQKKIIQLLLEHGFTPLHGAASHGYKYCTDALVNAGVNVNSLVVYVKGSTLKQEDANNGYSVLSCACHVGATSIVKLLIKAKANIEHRSLTRLTPLMEAVNYEHVEVAQVFLAKANAATKSTFVNETALILAIENEGNIAFWIACNEGYHKIVNLLKNKANPDAADNAAISPLLTAIKNGQVEVVKLLLEENAVLPTNSECARYSSVPKQSIDDCTKLVSEAKVVNAERAKALADSFLEQTDMEKASKNEDIEAKREDKTKSEKAK